VRRALGDFWGFQEAWLSLASSVFDMAAYPAVFVLSLGELWPGALEHRYAIAAAVIGLCIVWNLAGAKAVGEGSIGLGLALLAPFAVLAILHVFRADESTTVPANVHHEAGVGWFAGVLVAMWNLMGWDNASTVAQEVDQPQRNYPRVMLATLALIVACYLVPFLAAWRAGVPEAAWTTGSWVAIAEHAGGPWLGRAILIGTMISVFGILNSLTMSYSRLPLAMAADGYAPRALLRVLRNGSPWVSLVACGAAWALALGLSFDRILLLDILLYGASLMLEFAALVALRLSEPQLPRPFQVPGGMAGAVAVGLGPLVILAAAFWTNRGESIGTVSALGVAMAIMLAGGPAYWLARRRLS
jgi:amino acid transporter